MATRRSSRRSSPLSAVLPALAAAAVCVGIIVAIAQSSDDDDDAASAPRSTTTSSSTTTLSIPESTTTTTEPPEPVAVDRLLQPPLDLGAPTTYRITFAVVENDLARTETWTVRRPYESFVDSTRDGARISGNITALDNLYFYFTDRKGWVGIQPERHRAGYDSRFEGAVPVMIELGLVEELGASTEAGRRCTEYRTGKPIGGTEVGPPTAEESVDFCIDGDGLLLREVWSRNGHVVTERRAAAVEVGLEVPDSTFTPDAIAESAEDFDAVVRTQVRPLDDEGRAALGTDVEAPSGWTEDGGVIRTGTTSSGASNSTEIVRFYRRGPDLVEVIEYFVDTAATLDDPAGAYLELDGWAEAWFVPGFRTNSLRLRLDESHFVEIDATLPQDAFAFADGLTRRER